MIEVLTAIIVIGVAVMAYWLGHDTGYNNGMRVAIEKFNKVVDIAVNNK